MRYHKNGYLLLLLLVKTKKVTFNQALKTKKNIQAPKLMQEIPNKSTKIIYTYHVFIIY